MKLSLLHRRDVPPSASPYRLVNDQGQEIAWANEFLDAQRVRQPRYEQITVRSLSSEEQRCRPLENRSALKFFCQHVGGGGLKQ